MKRRFSGSGRTARERAARPRIAGVFVAMLPVLFTLGTVLVSTVYVTAQDSTGTPGGGANVSTQEVEVLRKLLGLPAPPPPPAPEPVPVVEPVPAPAPPPEPAVVEEPPPPAPAPEKPAAPDAATPEAPKAKPKPAVTKTPPKKPAAPVVKAPPKPAQKPGRAAPLPPEERPAIVQTPKPGAQPKGAAISVSSPSVPTGDIPAPGTVIDSNNLDRWKHLLGPSLQWSVSRGAKMDVIAYKPTPMEPFREEATQRYHAQVELAPDKRSLRNYVAGIPFPFVTEEDTDAAVKMMFNFENRIAVDDMDIRNFSCDTGSVDDRGFTVQRHYVNEHFRRLYYVSRFHHEPKPLWPNQEGIRHREMLYPLLEPFDLKGAGFTYIRYQDPSRQDDSWLYFPQMKRVRRLGTAQRSEGVFGQDIDLDSYGGYSGNPAWMQWQFLGRKTVLAPMHASKHIPGKFQEAPANFFPDDYWEPRDVYVILGVSELGGYNLGRRIIYLDRESMLIPYTEMYDLKGGLWKAFIQMWHTGNKPRPDAVESVYDYNNFYIRHMTLIDMQLDHATRCQFPGDDMPKEESWYYNQGPTAVSENQFEVANFIQTGR